MIKHRFKTDPIESLMLFAPVIILSLSGALNSETVVFGCLCVQFVSVIILSGKEHVIVADRKWKNIFITLFVVFAYLLLCSIVGYSPIKSLRITALIFINVFLLGLNCWILKEKNIKIVDDFFHWCLIFATASVVYSLLCLINGSGFELIGSEEDGVMIVSTYHLGPFLMKQYAVQGGLINGNLGVASWFINPNTFSIFCLITYCYCLYSNKKWFIPVGIIGVLLGFSRAAIVLLLFVTFLFLYKTISKIGKVLFVFISAVIIVYILSAEHFSVDYNGRLIIWDILLNYARDNYYFPNGLGTSPIILKDYGGIVLSTHNLFINILLETGVIGMFTFFIVIGKTLKKASLYFKRTGKSELLYSGILLLCLIILGMTEVTMLTFSFLNYICFYLIFTIMSAKDDYGFYANI